MEPQAGKIQPLPVQVFYNHSGITPTSLPGSAAPSGSATEIFAPGPTCSLLLSTAQDVFVHPRCSGQRKRRRTEGGNGVEVKDEEGERVGGRAEEEWEGSVSLKSLMRAICFASPDLMPSHSVPDSSVYVPTRRSFAGNNGRTTYEGKGLLSLVLTEPAPGRTVVRGRLVRSSAFSSVPCGADEPEGSDDDKDGGGGGLEALVRAAKKRKEREEAEDADEDEKWGLEVEILLKALPGWPARAAAGGIGAVQAQRVERSSSAVPLPLAPPPGRRKRSNETARDESETTSWRVMPTSAMGDEVDGDSDAEADAEEPPLSAQSSARLPLPPAYRDRQSSAAPVPPPAPPLQQQARRSESRSRQSVPPAQPQPGPSSRAASSQPAPPPPRHLITAPRPRQIETAQSAHGLPSMPASDPGAGPSSGPHRAGRKSASATPRAASVEPMILQPSANAGRTIQSSNSRAGTPRAAPAPGATSASDTTSRVDPMALARTLLKNPNPGNIDIATRLVGRTNMQSIIGEMAAEINRTKAEGAAVQAPAADSQAAQAPGLATQHPAAIYRCDNCGTTETSTWRVKMLKDGKEKRVCDDCGLYFNDHKRMRPKHLWGLKGDAALGRGEPPSSKQGKERPKPRPLPRTRSSHDGTEQGSSSNPLTVPDSPLKSKRATLDGFASPRRSSRLKTGQTPSKSSPTHRGLSNEFSEMDDSPSKHLRATPRRQAQARNMEHDMNTHAPRWKLGDKSNITNGHNHASSSRASGGLAASPFASAANGPAPTEAQAATAATDKMDDYNQQIMGLLAQHGGPIEPGTQFDVDFTIPTGDQEIDELLKAMAADPNAYSNDNKPLSQADIESLAQGFLGSAAGSSLQAGDIDWQALTTSPWTMTDDKGTSAGQST